MRKRDSNNSILVFELIALFRWTENTLKMSIGVPIKVLHEAEGHIITCETNTGEVYRGKLIEAEDNMNCQMQNITVTYRDGRTAQLENVYIRGSKIRFLILPDMLKNAPMFKRPGGKGSGTAGRGKSAILRAQGMLNFVFLVFLFKLLFFINVLNFKFYIMVKFYIRLNFNNTRR